jgi:signal transduction histidine kinase
MTPNNSHALLQGWYDYREVALSVLMAVSASYAALDLAGRAAAGRGRARRLWLTGAIFALTSGIWAMHYTAMLAFKLPVPVAYDMRLVVVSWLPAIFGSAVALYLFTREHRGRADAIVGSIFAGGGISGLHYTSMMSMRGAFRQLHNPTLVAASVVIAIVFSLIGLTLAFYPPQKAGRLTAGGKTVSVLAMGAAICVMHYTGMAAITFVLSHSAADISYAVSISPLGIFATALVMLILQGLAVLTSFVDRRFGAQRELSARILKAQDQERRRLARHLHETVAQSLAALKMNLAKINRASTVKGNTIGNTVADSIALADDAMREARTLSYLLHPPLFEESGLASALEWYATGFGERSGIKVTLEIPAELGRLPEPIETAVFRMVQECLTNIHRHSGSTTAKVKMVLEEGSLLVEVEDEGRGMPARNNKFVGALLASGVGLAGIRERVMQLGGRLEFDTSSRGTKVSVILPLKLASLWQKHAS